MRTLENYKKGDKVWVHANDKREWDYVGYVKSVGKQYVTVCEDEECSWKGTRFNVEGGYNEGCGSWELFHNEEECKQELEKKERRRKFHLMTSCFNDEEIETILTMYEKRTGIKL